MLNATAQKLGDSTVLRCQGRIVLGDAYAILRNAVLRQTHARTLILDLAQVDRIEPVGWVSCWVYGSGPILTRSGFS